jgi:hypothetical protein
MQRRKQKAHAKLLRQVPYIGLAAARAACLSANHLWLQRFELLVAVMLARARRQPAGIAGVLPSELTVEVITLPSGLLAVVCEAIMRVTVRAASADCRATVGGASKLPSRRCGLLPSASSMPSTSSTKRELRFLIWWKRPRILRVASARSALNPQLKVARSSARRCYSRAVQAPDPLEPDQSGN